MRRMSPLLICLVLPACLSQQSPQTPDKPVNPPYLGVISLEDVTGAKPQALFSAVFYRRPESASAATFRAYKLLQAEVSRVSEPQCQLASGPKSRELAKERSDYLNVGVLRFGPALQGSYQESSPDEKNRYLTSVSPGIPAGLYQVVGSGKDSIAKFGDYLSMPEELHEPTGNDVPFVEGLPLKAKQALNLAWKKPAVANQGNWLLLDILAESETELFDLSCSAEEAYFQPEGEKLKWQIPADLMAKLPVTNSAAVFFVRAHVRRVASSQLELALQGIRTYPAAAAILDIP